MTRKPGIGICHVKSDDYLKTHFTEVSLLLSARAECVWNSSDFEFRFQ